LAENLRVIGRWLERPYLFVFPAAGAIAAIVLAASVLHRRDGVPFYMVAIMFAATEHDHDVMRLLRSFRYVPGPQRSSRQPDTPGAESSDSLHERR
jgi:hypothetical protein